MSRLAQIHKKVFLTLIGKEHMAHIDWSEKVKSLIYKGFIFPHGSKRVKNGLAHIEQIDSFSCISIQ